MLVDVLSESFCDLVDIGDIYFGYIPCAYYVVVRPKQSSAGSANSASSTGDDNVLGWVFHGDMSIGHVVCCQDKDELTCSFFGARDLSKGWIHK